MIQRIALVCLAAAGFFSLATFGRADWVKFTSPDKKFEAQFPSDPKETEQKTPGGAVKLFMAMEGTTTYLLSTTSMPAMANADADTLTKTMETSRDAVVKQLKGKLVSDKKVELDKKYQGREYVVEGMGGAVHIRQRMYIIDGTLYQMVVGGTSADAVTGKDATTFVESFKLKK